MSDTRGHDFDAQAAEPAPGDATEAAREQFVHGLLETLHKDGAAEVERRVAGVLERLGEPLQLPVRRRWQLWSGLAAAILLIVAGILGIPTERSAAAMVRASLEASRTAGDRRYDVRAVFGDAPEVHYATLDVRDPEHYVIRATLSGGDDLVLGRDAQGDWAIKFHGEIDRLPPRRLLPPWVHSGEGAVAIVSVDDVLGSLSDSYTLKRLSAEPPPGGKGPACQRVSATRQSAEGSGPQRVELWMEAHTNVLLWMELYWDPSAAGDDSASAPDRSDGGRRDGPGDGLRGKRKDGPPNRPPSDRPPPPDRDHRDRPPPGGGPRVEGGPSGPTSRPFTNPFKDRRSPPRRLVFELSSTAAFPEAWFDPTTHERK